MTFIIGLKKEWKNIFLMIKTQVNFDTYSLLNLYKILKAHESKLKEMAKENIQMNFGCLMALVSKTNGNGTITNDEAGENEEVFF